MTSATPPKLSGYHLTLDDVAEILGAKTVHEELKVTGKGCSVALVDTGWYDHPYFTARKQNAHVVIVTPAGRPPRDPATDETGHGTGMAANLLAVAPDATVKMYKVHSFIDSLWAAVESDPDLISISKGPTFEENERDPRAMEYYQEQFPLIMRKARENGTLVLVASGNTGSTPILVEHADLVVGGVYRDETGMLEASNYAMANPKLRLPDICGLCGQQPNAMYIALPTQPGSKDDQEFSQGGDGTAPDDGWLLASGTSSATPQVAGICALMRQAVGRRLTTEEVRNLLQKTATPVTQGHSFDKVAADKSWSRLANALESVQATVHPAD